MSKKGTTGTRGEQVHFQRTGGLIRSTALNNGQYSCLKRRLALRCRVHVWQNELLYSQMLIAVPKSWEST